MSGMSALDFNLYMAAGLAVLYGLMLLVAHSAAYEQYPPSWPARRRRFWLIAGALFVAMEALALVGAAVIPVAIMVVIMLVVVVGGFIAALSRFGD